MKKQNKPPRKPLSLHWTDIPKLIQLVGNETIHIDFETMGTALFRGEVEAVSIGVAWEGGCVHIYLDELSSEELSLLWEWLGTQPHIAFNSMFDSSVVYKYTGKVPNTIACSFILFRLLAAEGYLGQQWNLDTACQNVLGWHSSQKKWLKEALHRHGLRKNEMWKLKDLEREMFAKYCVMDAEASYQLYKYFEAFCTHHQFDALWRYHHEEGIAQVKRLIPQYFNGIMVNRELMEERAKLVLSRLSQAEQAIRNSPLLFQAFKEFGKIKLKLELEKYDGKKRNFEQYRVPKERKQPSKYTKAGKLTKGWKKWWVATKLSSPVTTRAWMKWKGKRNMIKRKWRGNAGALTFNPGSAPDKVKLFYSCLWPNWKAQYTSPWNPDKITKYIVQMGGQGVEIDATKEGELPTGKEALPYMGDIGKLFLEWNKWEKLKGFYVAYLIASEMDSSIHHTQRPACTHTGRVASGEDRE